MMPRKTLLFKIIPLMVLLNSVGCNAADDTGLAGQTVEQAYPGLASVSLGQAVLAKLPKGLLLKSGEVVIKAKDLEAEIAKAPQESREQLRKNGFFLLEQMATGRLLEQAARREAAINKADLTGKDQREIIQGYFENRLASVVVSDSEVEAFYRENRDAIGDAKLDQVKGQLQMYLLQQKKQEAVAGMVRELGREVDIQVSAPWVKAQAVLAKENPVDKARTSGRPTMVDFGADGCRPCDMMTPILEELKKEYDGRANILFIHVNREQILAARFGIQSIPVQVFFDKNGQEVFRHTGFFPKDEILKQFKSMGL